MSEEKHRRNWKRSVTDFFGKDFLKSVPDFFDHDRPEVNIYESDRELMILAALPGVDNIRDVNLFIHHQSLVIKGNVHYPYEGFKLAREELTEGAIERTVDLPHPVNTEPVNASYKRGLLKIVLTKIDRREYSQIIMDED